MVQKVEISYKTILFAIFSLLACWFFYQIRTIIVLVFVSLLLAFTISPLVDKIQRLKIPRMMAIFLVYILVIGIFSSFLSVLIPALIEQTATLTENLSGAVQYLPLIKIDWQAVTGQIEMIARNAVGLLRLVISAASNVLTVLTILVLTFYFIYEKENFGRYINQLFDGYKKEKVNRLIERLDSVLGGWLRGQIILMFIVGLMSFIGLSLLGLNYVLPLSLLAGLLEFIPNLGPALSAIPAVIVGFTISPVMGLGTFLLYLIIQQVENYVIVPQVMKRVTGIHPLVSLLCLMVGGKIYGFVGMLLAIPIFLLVRTSIEEFWLKD